MVDLSKTNKDPLQQLWDILEDTRAGMLGVEDSGQPMQPMAPQLEKESNSVWFYTRSDSDLVKAVHGGGRAQFCVISKDHDYHAYLAGSISENKSREHIDKFWSPVISAWFEGGKDDPLLTMLQLKLDDAAIWASSNNTLRFGWEMAKANLTGKEPDLGVRTHISLPHQ
ncbi:pyridoxamine 5'-phosphate oxidase family protein [Rhizobium sp. 32-5/1]|uniref:pyridoxamine 5'-phosphate oxidase family protein n=1 Tax=Rhizobium sp. 32-5/1 TaxID=3019602 RepID=UPI00240E64FC|nr:pyridoxamine 5'-phosphate oxidase family protein [Rhizobium sp. 32-5/1]WEZ81979.1 pyridoxamine 5'-phosphate oxidase family protein [Rhizobium sp. 32-5/1]